jgi:multidrug resistance protein, MATE family
VSTLKGAGDTRFILWVSAVVSPPPVLIVWAGIRWFDLGILWSWTIITLWIIALGLIYGGRYLQGRWRTMWVIEPDVAREEKE